MSRTDWTHEQVRAWVERHGGDVVALARRLRVHRSRLSAWMADPEEVASARPVPAYIVAHMQSLDRLASVEAAGAKGE